MEELRGYIEKWLDGQNIKGIKVSLIDIKECVRIYNALVRKEKQEFINGKLKEILDKCKIRTVEKEIGWRVA